MSSNRQSGRSTAYLPPITGNLRTLLFALGGLYFAELILRNFLGSPVDMGRWFSVSSLSGGFELYQLATRYLVQGNSPLGVLLPGLIMVFFVPFLIGQMKRNQSLEVLIAMLIGGTLTVLGLDVLGLVSGQTYGWGSLTIGLVVLFGLIKPDATVNLFFVLPVKASLFTWGTGVITLFYLAASPTLESAERFGIFLGVIAWWQLRGPAARRRNLIKKSREIEKDLSKFTVHEGGRGDKPWH